jgi:hypothetical protein
MQGDNGSYEIATNLPRIKFECKDVSFTSPLRKKLKLQFVTDTMNISKHQIRLLNQTTHAIEYTLRGEDVDAMFCLPVPEKTQRQQCFLIFPLPGSQSYDGTPAEPLVWTMNETKGSPEIVGGATRLDGSEEDTLVEITRRELDSFMAALSRKTILPNEREFASEIPQSHRKNEKAFHTKAFRGSKEGPSISHPRPSTSTNQLTAPPTPRLPLPPLHRHSLRLQKTRLLLPLQQHRKHLFHIRPPTNLQHSNHNHHNRPHRLRSRKQHERNFPRTQHGRPSRLPAHRRLHPRARPERR